MLHPLFPITLHKDLSIKIVTEEPARFYENLHTSLKTHQNPLIENLSTQTLPDNPRRRQKKRTGAVTC